MPTIAVILKVWNEESLIELCLSQFNNTCIDTLYIFNDGCTDSTIKKALALKLSYKVQIVTVSKSHTDYFPKQSQIKESSLLNRMIKTASRHDWVVHVDADEMLSPQLLEQLNNLDQLDKSTIGVYLPYTHLVDSLNKYIITMPGCAYDLYPDCHMRIFRPNCWRFPVTNELDSIIQPATNGNVAYSSYPMIHLHYLNQLRRGLRGGKSIDEDGSKQYSFRQEGCTYGVLDDAFIPGGLVEWYENCEWRW